MDESGIKEGLVLVSAMHITVGVRVNDDEPGILKDVLEWLDKLAPPTWQPASNEIAEKLYQTAATTVTTSAEKTTPTRT